MDFDRVNEARHSVRDFDSKPISEEDIRAIVESAQHAPSWVNSQPWSVYVATGATLEKIRQMSQQNDDDHVRGHSDLPVLSRVNWAPTPQKNMREWSHDIVAHFDSYAHAHETMSGLTYELTHAPAIAYITIPEKSAEWSVFDAGLFAQTLMLAAKNRGIDSIPTYNLVRFPTMIRQIMGIPEDEKLIIGIELGYAATAPINTFRSSRLPLDDMLTIKD